MGRYNVVFLHVFLHSLHLTLEMYVVKNIAGAPDVLLKVRGGVFHAYGMI